jgi:hypothetical protein
MSLKAKRVWPAKRAGGVQKRNGPAGPFRFRGGFCGPQPLVSLGFRTMRNETGSFRAVTGKASRFAPQHTFSAGKEPYNQWVSSFALGRSVTVFTRKTFSINGWRLFPWIIGRHLPMANPCCRTRTTTCITVAGPRMDSGPDSGIHWASNAKKVGRAIFRRTLPIMPCGREASALSLYDLCFLASEAWGEQVAVVLGFPNHRRHSDKKLLNLPQG